ncbi:hypothetical protein HPB47_018005, partial [Ixodes persulcatus]
VENEYGSYHECDFVYTAHLKDLMRRHLGPDVLLYTTDGSGDGYLTCGKNDGAYSTIDFGPGSDVVASFAAQRRHQDRGPLMNSEFYSGWLDNWGDKHWEGNASAVAETLREMLTMNASVNIYVFHGGSSFGCTAGANLINGVYAPNPTSYDYDAPMNEAGDPTEMFEALRQVISEFLPEPPLEPVPSPKAKMALGPFTMKRVMGLKDIMTTGSVTSSEFPLSFEQVGHGHGLMIYYTKISFRPRDPAVLHIPGLRDRGYVYVENEYKGLLSRMDNIYDVLVPIKKGQNLAIVVENQGRIADANGNNDTKSKGEYRMSLPALPTGKRLATTVFLHSDPRVKPYKIGDFARSLDAAVGMKNVAALGAFQLNHVWVCTLHDVKTRDRLTSLGELTVKERRCVIVDPNVTEASLRVHWLPTYVNDEEVSAVFRSFGRIKDIQREMWRALGGEYEIETSTRIVTLLLRDGLTRDELPHQATVSGYPVLVSVAGRPPLCLRCRQVGHMGRQCKAPWCRLCREVGHTEDDCAPTYATRARGRVTTPANIQLMDHDETEETNEQNPTAVTAAIAAEPIVAAEAVVGPGAVAETSEPQVRDKSEAGEQGKPDTPKADTSEDTATPTQSATEATASPAVAAAPVGFAFLNNFNLGRYWPAMGPQMTLYVPSVLFKERNRLLLLELERAPCGLLENCVAEFVKTPVINGAVPDKP